MTNHLIAARDEFSDKTREARLVINTRDWGLIHCGGEGPNLVLLPGTLGRADIFWQQIIALRGRVNILSLSYPASGNLEDWSHDVCAAMDKHGFTTASILGSSLGGYLAQYFAATNPDRVDNLIAANTLSSARSVRQFAPYDLDLDTTAISVLRDRFTAGMKASLEQKPQLADLVGLLLQEVAGRILEPEMRARLKALKFGPEIPALSLPGSRIFTVESDDDPLIPPPMREAVRARLGPDRNYHFAAGSHFPYVIQPRDYTAMIEECLGLARTSSNWPSGTPTTL